MSGTGTHITTATTTEISSVRNTVLKNIVVNEAEASATVTVYDNIAAGVSAADVDGIAVSQTPVGAGNLTLNGAAVTDGVAYLGYGRTVDIECAADENARTFTVTGTLPGGQVDTEAISGVAIGTASGTKNFVTVTQIAVDAATAGAVEAGFTVQTGTEVAIITMPGTLLQNHFTLNYEVKCKFGLTVVTTGTSDLTVVSD